MSAMHFSYRAVTAEGAVSAGTLDATDRAAALDSLRRMGVRPIAIEPLGEGPARSARLSASAARKAAVGVTGDLAALLGAGLPLNRALALALANVQDKAVAAQLERMQDEVRGGAPLSSAIAAQPAVFPPVAAAMAEAGEANGRQAQAIERLAHMLEQAEDLRRTVTTATIYPAMLTIVALGVILLMLLFVVPQFESLFAQAKGELPTASRVVMGASRLVRDWGLAMLAGLVAAGIVLRQMLRRPAAALAMDAMVLRLPQIGTLVRHIETARFARTLGSLVEGDVPLVKALVLARRTVSNRTMGQAVEEVAMGVRQGGGLAVPLIASGVLPPLAHGFLRTGEETSQIGPMLLRLADVLDRDVRTMLQRLIGVLTPAITILMGTTVAAIIAAIMSAIIGFNDLAIAS